MNTKCNRFPRGSSILDGDAFEGHSENKIKSHTEKKLTCFCNPIFGLRNAVNVIAKIRVTEEKLWDTKSVEGKKSLAFVVIFVLGLRSYFKH